MGPPQEFLKNCNCVFLLLQNKSGSHFLKTPIIFYFYKALMQDFYFF